MSETWKQIKDWPRYEVSDFGNVRWRDTGRLLKLYTTPKGYRTVFLRSDAKPKNRFVHGLVARAFIPLDPERSFVNHKNGIKDDNRAENLEWVTAKENSQHAATNGLFPSRSKVESKIAEIRALNHEGFSTRQIGARLGICHTAIARVLSGRTWKHLAANRAPAEIEVAHA